MKMSNGYPTVEELRNNGYKVRVSHRRWFYSGSDMALCHYMEALVRLGSCECLEVGGQTVVEVTTPDNIKLTGIAECSVKDTFNRKRGLAIALGRALKEGAKE